MNAAEQMMMKYLHDIPTNSLYVTRQRSRIQNRSRIASDAWNSDDTYLAFTHILWYKSHLFETDKFPSRKNDQGISRNAWIYILKILHNIILFMKKWIHGKYCSISSISSNFQICFCNCRWDRILIMNANT